MMSASLHSSASEASVVSLPKAKKGFISYIHNFRGIAIIFVIAGHLLLEWPKDSLTYLFLRALWENGTVLFVFIAGYLFQYLSRKFEYKDYLLKKLQNVLIPYVIVSIPIIVFRIYQNDYPGYLLAEHPDFASWSAGYKILYFMLHGAHMQQLWFVPMITLFYLAAPVLIYIDRHPVLYWLLIPLVALSLFVDREPFIDIFKMFGHFLSVYLFGMFMSRYKEQYLEFAKKFWVIISILTIASLALTFMYYEEFKSALNYTQKMLFCCFFIYWLWRLDKYIPKLLGYLAEISFGLFFIHYYFILIIKAMYEKVFHHGIPGNIFYWTADLILVFALSILTIVMVKKLFPKYSRNLIGC